MTKEEIKKIIMYLRTVYQSFCEDANLTAVINVWYDAFRDENINVLYEAVRNYARSSEYPPTIAGIQNQIIMIREEETDTELWARIVKAAKNSTYGSVEEYAKLPPVCQKFLGSPAALKDFGQISEGTLETVVKGQFIKAAPQIRQHHYVQQGLPMEVRLAIADEKRKLLEDSYE